MTEELRYPENMASAVTVRGHFKDPRHIELDQPVTDFLGEVDIVLRSVPASTPAERVARARALQASLPKQTSDSVDLIHEDRSR